MRRSRIPALILTGLLLGAAAIVGGPRAERGGALLQSYRADILQRVRVARILTDVALGLVEHALDHGVVAPR